MAWAFHTTQRVNSKENAILDLPQELAQLGTKKLLLITDPGIVKAGILQTLKEALKAAKVTLFTFEDVIPEPPYELIDKVTKQAKKDKIDTIIGIGGGSSLDVAKVVSVALTNTMSIHEMFGINLIKKPGLPVILIPTTAGTGSEATPIAILSDEKEQLKKGIVSPYLYPFLAILDPVLTLGLPPQITAPTGIDALIHALEGYISKNANPVSDMWNEKAIRLISRNIRTAYADGSNKQARSAMLEGSYMAGVGFANAGVAAVHAFAYPIGAQYHIPHGLANSLMLLPVFQFNMIGNLQKFACLAELLGEKTEGLSLRQAAQQCLHALENLIADLNLPQQLRDFGAKEKELPQLAENVMKVSRLLNNNPRIVTEKDALTIYTQAF